MTQPELDSIRPIETASPTDFTTNDASQAPAAAPRQTAAAKAPARTAAAHDDLAAAVSAANSNLAAYNRVMDFKVDSASGLSIAFIRNAQTGEVLQQIPGTDMVKLAQMLRDWSPGKNLLIDLTA
jgi:flagellar protein FlaG